MLHRTIVPLSADIDPKGGGKTFARIANWLQKSLYFLYILLSLELGVLLLCLPWMWVWENNYLLYLYPQFRPLVSNPFFKGFVLGLGIVNILIGIYEVAHFKHGWNNRDLSR
jgi:hypothetical protein